MEMMQRTFNPQKLGFKEVLLRPTSKGVAVVSSDAEGLDRLASAIQESSASQALRWGWQLGPSQAACRHGAARPAAMVACKTHQSPPNTTWLRPPSQGEKAHGLDHLSDLRRVKHNRKVYEAITEDLSALGIKKTIREVKTKIENLGNQYSAAIKWKFYWALHEFLRSLPANDRSLTEESGCPEASVEEIIFEMQHGSPDDECEDEEPPLETSEPPPDDPTTAGGSSPSAAELDSPASSSSGSVCSASGCPRSSGTKKKSQRNLLSHLLEEQRQLRLAIEKSRLNEFLQRRKEIEQREKEIEQRERLVALQEKAAEREERFIAALEKFCK
ncbi:hypothetical protein HPB48_022119 [Haemaphysalis longicornis]|uniref:Myb/SANT-like DNA-binding domain-containing protein n=1 Tax=Haemaphysalis longicornis TaxID=44386 RepID=A0A9J6H3B4_HAELO|nr:hypothetical protein HPB48_022119 [Haemaphysalis longicornis]